MLPERAGIIGAMHVLIPYASAPTEAVAQVLRDLSLPTLARLLARWSAQAPDEGDEATLSPPHESALARSLGWHGRDGAWPYAARAAAADGIDVGDAAWGLATPAHWEVGRDHVLLSDPADLALDEAESRALFEAARESFESEGFRVEWGAPLRWYLAHDSLDGLACASLDRVIARPIEPWLRPDPQAADTSRLVRRLQSELQMLLYAHPVNEARERRGAPTVNSFWLSGCGRFQPARQAAPRIDERLRAPLLADDLAAWAQAWTALDADTLRALLDAASSGQAASLTLCGERRSQRFEHDPRAPRSAWRRLADRWRSVEPHTLLEAL